MAALRSSFVNTLRGIAARPFSTAAPLRNVQAPPFPAKVLQRPNIMKEFIQSSKPRKTDGPNLPSPRDLAGSQINFVPGDLYSPKLLSRKAKQQERNSKRGKDMFADITGGHVDAIDELRIKDVLMRYKDVAFLSRFTTQMGRIKHRKETGLRGVNQRRIAKAIRRSVGLGLLPSVHRHPELLRWHETKYNRY